MRHWKAKQRKWRKNVCVTKFVCLLFTDIDTLDMNKVQQCNKHKSELVQLRKQQDLAIDDLVMDEG